MEVILLVKELDDVVEKLKMKIILYENENKLLKKKIIQMKDYIANIKYK
tara:strand:- start:272 stop:418 length:147 start_codon:yes stop_codon:yes gene_type:complete